jgi:hypothetical protein
MTNKYYQSAVEQNYGYGIHVKCMIILSNGSPAIPISSSTSRLVALEVNRGLARLILLCATTASGWIFLLHIGNLFQHLDIAVRKCLVGTVASWQDN